MSAKESLEAVAEATTQLQRLSCAIRKSSVQSRHSKAASFIIKHEDGSDGTSDFKKYFLSIVKTRYSKASDSLANRLANSMLLRRRRFLYSAEHQHKLSQSGPESPNGPEVIGGNRDTAAPSKSVASLPRSQTTASVLDQQIFQVKAEKSESSVRSSRSTYGYNENEYPPAPLIVSPASECICPYCFEILSGSIVRDEKQWRRHLRGDLEPYVCVFDSCNQPVELFSTSKEWLEHMRWEHGMQWYCMQADHAQIPFSSREEFQSHLSFAHSDSFTELDASVLADQRARPVVNLFIACPLCEEIPSDTEISRPVMQQDHASKILEGHIKKHLESLALMSLPWRDDEEIEISESASENGEILYEARDDEEIERSESASKDGEIMFGASWPAPSFLFTVNELPLNEDPTEGGEIPRVNEYGEWHPPIRRNGFGPRTPSAIYRWSENGNILSAEDCQWFNGQWWSQAGTQLTEYRASTVFWCNNFTQFLVATGDASTRHMDESPDPGNRWWPLKFEHENSLSRVQETGSEPRLAVSGSWIDDLGIGAYRSRRTRPAGGLAGNLAIVIGLIAFSCEPQDLYDVLINDRALRSGARWHGHNRGDGRIEERGVVVTIYYDSENPQGSTTDTLYALEWSSGPFLQ